MNSKKVQFIRTGGTLVTETTVDEKKYRETHLLDVNRFVKEILDSKCTTCDCSRIDCTACGKNIRKEVKSKDIHIHPVLQVLWCKNCQEYYKDGEFSADEDGSDKYCRWCAEGGNVYCCSYCSVVFCKKCVKRNFPKGTLKEIDKDDWKCFVCVTEPLWKLRAVCDVVKRYADSAPKDDSESNRITGKSTTESDIVRQNRFTNTKRRKKHDNTETNDYRVKYVEVDYNEETEKLKVIVADLTNKWTVLRESMAKREAEWKQNYLADNLKNWTLNETKHRLKEEFSKFLFDMKCGLDSIEKSFVGMFEALDNESSEAEEIVELSSISPIKKNDFDVLAEVVDDNENEKKMCIFSTDNAFDMSLTLLDDWKTLSINSSLEVHIFSTIDSLNSNDTKELCNRNHFLEAIEPVEMEICANRTPEKLPRKLSVVSTNGVDDID